MKILLFTHEQDIDGMGSILLCQKANFIFDFITCKTFEINNKVQQTIDNKEIYKYNYIYVTDLCIKEPLLTFINNDLILRKKLIIFDHHKSEIDEGNNKYDFVNIVVENAKGKVSGTSLFYEFLLKNNLIKETKSLDLLVEWTRQYDTWEWKKYNNVKARMLHILFETQGYKKYLELIGQMLENEDELIFTAEEMKIIDEFNKKLDEDIDAILKGMHIVQLPIDNFTFKIGFVRGPYKYRNDINEKIKENNIFDIDTVGIIMEDMETVSYRGVKDIDVSMIATYFGGKGHKNAASNLQSNEKFKVLLKQISAK